MAKYKICPDCKKHNNSKAFECAYCEADLTSVKPTDDENEAAKAEGSEKNTQDDINNRFIAPINNGAMIRICENCGTHNPSNARKCVECGDDISDITPVVEEGISKNNENCTSAPCNQDSQTAYSLISITDGTTFLIDKTPMIIGREQALRDYLVDKRYVSRIHAELTTQEGKFFIRNINETNNTYVNNKHIGNDICELNDGDEIGLGGKVINGSRQDLAAYFKVKKN